MAPLLGTIDAVGYPGFRPRAPCTYFLTLLLFLPQNFSVGAREPCLPLSQIPGLYSGLLF